MLAGQMFKTNTVAWCEKRIPLHGGGGNLSHRKSSLSIKHSEKKKEKNTLRFAQIAHN